MSARYMRGICSSDRKGSGIVISLVEAYQLLTRESVAGQHSSSALAVAGIEQYHRSRMSTQRTAAGS